MYCNISIVLLVATHGQFPSSKKKIHLVQQLRKLEWRFTA
jgi:hypothetical protein